MKVSKLSVVERRADLSEEAVWAKALRFSFPIA